MEETSDRLGFYIDGICDLISIIWLLIIIQGYLEESEFMKLPVFVRYDRSKVEKFKRNIFKKVVCITAVIFLASIMWNRYILEFTKLHSIYGNDFIRCSTFLIIAWIWRLFNVHAILHYIMIAIFTNKLWKFFKVALIPLLCVMIYAIIVSEMLVNIPFVG